MSVYKPNSWGRTRRPKNSTKTDQDYITGSQDLADLWKYTIGGDLESNISPSSGIYVTENQRFMHLQSSGSASGVTGVFLYLYASNSWSELLTGSAGQPYGPVVLGPNEHRIIEIYGADMVAFSTASAQGPAVTNKNYAAFSTF